MRIKFPRYLTASLSVFFIFICSFTHGQTKGAKEALENADRLYVKEKFEDARTLYLQHAANLSPAQQMNWVLPAWPHQEKTLSVLPNPSHGLKRLPLQAIQRQ